MTGNYGPAPGAGYGPPPGAGAGQPADLLTRFLARLIDYIGLFIINLIIVFVGFVAILGANASGMGGMGTGGSYAFGAASAVLQTVIYLGYYGVMESRNGQTVGKMLLGLQTQSATGGNPTLEQALKRNIFLGYPILGLIPFLGWLGGLASLVAQIVAAVNINSSPTRQGWHDTFGQTRVVRSR
jgi:uncharacterized RDD family membrane protein YckC